MSVNKASNKGSLIGNEFFRIFADGVLIYLTRPALAEYNYKINSKLPQFSAGQYIYNQNLLSEYKMGISDTANAGCGWVATYNALIALSSTKNKQI